MRVFIFLFCILSFGFTPKEGFSQNTKIRINSNINLTVDEVFSLIRQQTDYTFVYTSGLFKNAPKISLKKGTIRADKLLNKSLSSGNYSYVFTNDKTIVLTKRTVVEEEEIVQQIVTGDVTDEKGLPLAGAVVFIKGDKKGTTTDFDGKFTITANQNDILVFKYLGYVTKDVSITSSTNYLNIILKEDVNSLKEVVVTGYQKFSKERSTGSFTNAKVDVMQNRPVSGGNLLSTLDGLVPGLVINTAPNASLNPILIRGLTTIGTQDANGIFDGGGTNRNPLIVLDGIAVDDLSLIDAQNIASVTVLKDATAASIWGSRAANGVIVITTKKGKSGDKIKIAYDSYFNFIGKPDLDYVSLLNSQQFIENARLGFDPVSMPWDQAIEFQPAGRALTPHEIILYDQYRGLISGTEANSRLNELATRNNSKQIEDLVFRNAYIENHSLSLSGGGKVYSFYGSLGYNNFTSSNPGEKNNTFRVNLRQDADLNKNIQVYLITNLTNSNNETKRNPNISNTFIPYQLLRDENGNNLSMPYTQGISDPTRINFENRSRISLDYKPLDEFNLGHTKSRVINSRVTAGFNINLFDGLRFEGTYNYSNSQTKTTTFDSEDSYLVRRKLAEFTVADTPADNPIYFLPTSGGRLGVDNRNRKEWTVRNQFVFDKNWKDKHQITLLLGQEASERVSTSNSNVVWGYDEDLLLSQDIDIISLNNGVQNTVVPNAFSQSIFGGDDFGFRQTENITRLTSHYSNAAYTFNGKYTVNGSLRYDRSNLFGVDKSAQNKPVWSAGLKWQLDKEGFMDNISWVDRLSLRVTSGITGNAPSPGVAASEDVISFFSHPWTFTGQAADITSVGNRKLTWERTKNFNVGLDFSIFNTINGSFDVYNKETSDLLGFLDTNNFTGFPAIIGNVGDMSNKGIELSLTSTNIKNKNFSWVSSLVLSHNKNSITKLNETTPIVSGDQLTRKLYVEGHPAFSVFAYRFAGLDDLGDPQIELSDGTITKDFDKALPEDITNMGSSQPLWSGGFSNTFNYKNFTLMANTIFNLGHVMRKPNFWKFHGPWDRNVSTDFLNRWQNPGDENTTNIPSYVTVSNISNSRRNLRYFTHSDINVVSASYIKLRDITLSYSLPKDFIRKIKMEELKLRLTTNNIMLWKANKDDIDPEFQSAMPSMQNTLTFGIHASF